MSEGQNAGVLEPASTWKRRCTAVRRLIGDTPLLQLRCRLLGEERTVYAKLETLNLTGSIKDRMALHVLETAYTENAVRPGDVIAEATSGNTGIALAAVGRALGHSVRIFMPDWMSTERKQLIRSMGAEVVLVSAEEGGFIGAIERAEEYARGRSGVFLSRQFDNQANPLAHFETTGPELVRQLEKLERAPTAFVAGVGTGGTVMGVGRYLRSRFADVTIHPLEPANSPTLRTGKKVGKHRIQGISDEFVPSIVRFDELDEIVDVWDGEAIIAAQRIARELGLGVGISSGANLLGALKVALQQGPASTVVTVFPDSNKKYLSTDLCNVEPEAPEYLTRTLEFLGCDVLPGLR